MSKLPQEQTQSLAQNWSHLFPAICHFSKIILIALRSKDIKTTQKGNLADDSAQKFGTRKSHTLTVNVELQIGINPLAL